MNGKLTLANILTMLGVGAAIVWRLAVLQTHVEALNEKSDDWVTREELRRELHYLERRMGE